MRKTEVPIHKGMGGYERCPPSELWRLELDRNRQIGVNPTPSRLVKPNTFDQRDAGYLRGCFSGFEFVLTAIQQEEPLKLGSAFLQNLHKACVSGVTRDVAVEIEGSMTVQAVPINSEFRSVTGSGYSILLDPSKIDQNATEEGVRELIEEFRRTPLNSFVQVEKVFDEKQGREVPKVLELRTYEDIIATIQSGKAVAIQSRERKGESPQSIQKEVTQSIDELFHRYGVHIKQADNDPDKILHAIATLIRGIEVIHPFEDGNCRVLNKLMNILLIKNHLHPAVLTNPNRIDGFSANQLVGEIKQGMKNFDNICNGQSDNEIQGKAQPYSRVDEEVFNMRCCYVQNNPNVTMVVAINIVKSAMSTVMIPPQERKKVFNQHLEETMQLLRGKPVFTGKELRYIQSDLLAKLQSATQRSVVLPRWVEKDGADKTSNMTASIAGSQSKK